MSLGQRVRPSTFRDALGSEFIKMRSVRSTYLMLLAGAGIIIGLCGMGAGLGPVEGLSGAGVLTKIAFLGVPFGQIALAAGAVLAFTAEHESGGIRATLAAVPQRGRLIAAKAVAVGAVSVGFGLLVSTVSIILAYVMVGGRTSGVEPVTWDTVLRPTIGNALYLGAFGLLSFGVGVLLRNTAGTLTTLIGCALIAPVTFGSMGDAGDFLDRWWPTNAGQLIARVQPDGFDGLPPYAGFGVMCAAVAIVYFAAVMLFDRRDP